MYSWETLAAALFDVGATCKEATSGSICDVVSVFNLLFRACYRVSYVAMRLSICLQKASPNRIPRIICFSCFLDRITQHDMEHTRFGIGFLP